MALGEEIADPVFGRFRSATGAVIWDRIRICVKRTLLQMQLFRFKKTFANKKIHSNNIR